MTASAYRTSDSPCLASKPYSPRSVFPPKAKIPTEVSLLSNRLGRVEECVLRLLIANVTGYRPAKAPPARSPCISTGFPQGWHSIEVLNAALLSL